MGTHNKLVEWLGLLAIIALAVAIHCNKPNVIIEPPHIVVEQPPQKQKAFQIEGKIVTDAFTSTKEKFAKIREAMIGVESAKLKLEAANLDLKKVRSDSNYNNMVLANLKNLPGTVSQRVVNDMEQQVARDAISLLQAENKVKDASTDLKLAEAKVASELSKLDEEELSKWEKQ